ncbi:MAG: AAA family ATPase [Planctomycetota bacterium]|nr:MAG: AAA family ATPase [Planctomycetota bacterium]
MLTAEALDQIRARILARFPMLSLVTWEEDRWLAELNALAEELQYDLFTWSVTRGLRPQPQPPLNKQGPLHVLSWFGQSPPRRLLVLQDFAPFLTDPAVVRRLRDLAPLLAESEKTVLLLGPNGSVPLELERSVVRMDLPLPDLEELRQTLREVLRERHRAGHRELRLTERWQERLVKALLGLTEREARQSLRRALLDADRVDDDTVALLVSEKRHMLQGSDLLEFQELDATVDDVGGLQALKEWIASRSEAFTSQAAEQGIPAPKGVLLLGVQGCGKSLTARVTARVLGFPLVRLDVSSLLSSEVGVSERNLRNVLTLMEMIAPAVLWLDEIEKGFAGGNLATTSETTMVRLMGRFLTWMQENRAPVFVVATANQIEGLPPEMLRRGRFDELFFVDLPNHFERKEIFRIHLRKRGWDPSRYDLDQLADRTEGYSGAEIEQIVVSALVETFGRGNVLSQQDLLHAIEDTVPLSVTMEEKIFQLREWARGRCRPATPDSRVVQMLEAEQRQLGRDTVLPFDYEEPQQPAERPRWAQLLEHGQLPAAVMEFVRQRKAVTFPELLESFADVADFNGEQGLALRSDPKVILWIGLNESLAAALARILTSRKLFAVPDPEAAQSPPTIHDLPILTELPDHRVSRPMWLPVKLAIEPPPQGVGRLGRVARMMLDRRR